MQFIGARNRKQKAEEKLSKEKLAELESDAKQRRGKRSGKGTPAPPGAGQFKRKIMTSK